uniref:Uncharacterized protein n=1 Tax=Arundo donax TaxID=35708 RepID=A0A0A9DS27_ARUDO
MGPMVNFKRLVQAYYPFPTYTERASTSSFTSAVDALGSPPCISLATLACISRRAAASSSISFNLRFISSSSCSFAASSPAAAMSTSATSMSPSSGISWPYTSCSSSSMAA